MIRLAVRVAREQAEIVLAELLELSPGGLEETELDRGVVEYAIYGAPGELPSLGTLEAVAGNSLVQVSSEEVPDGWESRWREFHRPVTIGDTLTIRPPWAPPAATAIDVVIDPGQAFGTGAHPTSRLCLELLLELPAGGPCLDLGCGSGVVAIAAARLGYRPVLAVDNDPAATAATAENARRNAAEIEIRRHDLRCDPVLVTDTTVANLLAPLLLKWATRLGQAREVPQRLILGGILPSERPAIAQAFAARGLRPVEQRTSGDWAALVMVAGS